MKAPLIVAHRGYAARYPENTLAAFDAAVQCGISCIELDVQISRDGQAVVIHDDNLRRTCGLDLAVHDHDGGELARIDAAYRFPPTSRSPRTRIPLLRQVAANASQFPNLYWFIEIKEQSIARVGLEVAVEAVLAAAGDMAAAVISFDRHVVPAVRQKSGRKAGWVIGRWDAHSQQVAEQMAPDFLFCNHRKLQRPFRLWPGSWQWVFYEVKSARLAWRLAQAGAQMVETMSVETLMQAMAGDSA